MRGPLTICVGSGGVGESGQGGRLGPRHPDDRVHQHTDKPQLGQHLEAHSNILDQTYYMKNSLNFYRD